MVEHQLVVIAFYNSCNIRDEVYRGWEGDGVGVGAGGKPKAAYTIHKETNYNVVSSVEHRNSYSQPDRPRRSSAAV